MARSLLSYAEDAFSIYTGLGSTMKTHITSLNLAVGALVAGLSIAPSASFAEVTCEGGRLNFKQTMWLNHLTLAAGPNLISAVKLGDNVTAAAAEIVLGQTSPSVADPQTPAPVYLAAMPLSVPPAFDVTRILICPGQGTTKTDLATLQLTVMQSAPVPYNVSFVPVTSSLVEDDGAPNCARFMPDPLGALSPNQNQGPTVLSMNFANIPHPISIAGLGLRLKADPDSKLWNFVAPHQHAYQTGRGRGHNNTTAWTDEVCDSSGLCWNAPGDCHQMTPATDASTTPGTTKNKGKNKSKAKQKK